ncbi:MAG: AraC family transcriptional regulator [Lachnospiraceae bacterium]|nr:AraC family transcriptional regulator [Lachnospiraceae bacterium]
MPYHIETREKPFTANHMRKLQYPPHIHPHLELIYIKSGVSIATADNKKYRLSDGDLFLTFPNQIHFYHDESPIDAYMLIFVPDLFSDLKELFQKKSPVSAVLHADQLPEDIAEQLVKIRERLNSGDTFSRISAKGYLLSLLGEILPRMPLTDATADQDSIKRLLIYCTENYTEPLSLELLSKELHLNKYYISHIFQERMHLSYKDFINNLRVEHACKLLTKDAHITEVAYASGFTTIRTFNRAFLKHMGMTPREYIKNPR